MRRWRVLSSLLLLIVLLLHPLHHKISQPLNIINIINATSRLSGTSLATAITCLLSLILPVDVRLHRETAQSLRLFMLKPFDQNQIQL